jgi:hypothetical protein
MKELKMFEYKANQQAIDKIRNDITFTDLHYFDESLELALASGISFENWAIQHFGFNYNKSPLAIAICLDLIDINKAN